MRISLVALCCAAALASAGVAQQPSAFILVGARLVDGNGAPPLNDSLVVVRNGRVERIATIADPGALPPDAERIDVRGKTILPGFVNTHGHLADTSGLRSGPELYTRENLERQLALYARYGVTTVFSLGGDGPEGLALRDQRPADAARLFVAGPVITATTAAQAAADVDRNAAMGVDWLKFRVDDNLGSSQKMPKEAWKAVIGRGRERKLPVAAHVFYLDDAKDLLREGVNLIAHSIRDASVDAEFIALANERNVCVVPTLTREVSTFIYESTPAFFRDEFFLRHADPLTVAQLSEPARQSEVRESPSARQYKAALAIATANLKRLSDSGVKIAFGTDTGPPARFQGYFEHMELEMMVNAGLTPMQAIVAATGQAARCMKNTTGLGTIAPGAPADIVVYSEDPTRDIRNTRTIEAVWIGGTRIP